MEVENRIVIAIADEKKAYELAYVFLMHGAKENELELIPSVSELQDSETINWLVTEVMTKEQIPVIGGICFVVGNSSLSTKDVIAVSDDLSAEAMYQTMIKQWNLRWESEEIAWTMEESEKMGSRLYLTCSPVGGSGKTLGSLGICQELADQNKRVLYVNLETTQNFSCFLDEEEYCSDTFVELLKKGEKPEGKMLLGQVENGRFDYLKPLPDDCIVDETVLLNCQKIIEELLEDNSYDVIVTEIPCRMDGFFLNLMTQADKVLVFTLQDRISAAKFRKFINRIPISEELCLFICNQFCEEKENDLEDIQITEYIGKLAKPSLSSLRDNGCFCMTAEILR